MAFNPNELVRVTRANTRTGGVTYDLAYSYQTSKFRVSQEIFDEMDMNNHGLTLLEDRKDNSLVLAVEPNEQAVMHRGKSGSNKGREFTSSRMRVLLDQYGFKNIEEFQLELVNTIEGIKYYKISSEEEPKAQVDQNQDDTVPVDNPPQPGPASVDLEEGTTEKPAEDTVEDPFAQTAQEYPATPDQAYPEDPADNPFGDVGAPEEPEEETEESEESDEDDLDSLLL